MGTCSYVLTGTEKGMRKRLEAHAMELDERLRGQSLGAPLITKKY